MKIVIIISYFFPPCNFVGAERTDYWAKNLHKYGIYPIIVTRCWNQNQKDIIGKVSANNYVVEKHDTHEVHRVPVKYTLRDRCANIKVLRPLRKLLTLIEVLTSYFTLKALPYYRMHTVCREILEDKKEIQFLIASGRPFEAFFIGHQLKKEFDHIKWIPDYRDEWNTHQNINRVSLFHSLIHRLELKNEIKWTKNADFFLSTSDYWVKRIREFTGIKGYTVMNGYIERNFNKIQSDSNILKIVYAGTLYSSQKVEYLINACISAIEDGLTEFEVYFIGTEMNPGENNKLQLLVNKHKKSFYMLSRMTKSELDSFLSKADLLYLTAFENVRGWYPVKLFDYYVHEKPILLCPSDNDVMEEFIVKTNSGYIANNTSECYDLITTLMKQKQNNEKLILNRNKSEGMKYTREFQTKVLAELINSK